MVLKDKKFGDLEISKFFRPETIKAVEAWIANGQTDDNISSVYFTVRNVHTFIKQLEVPSTSFRHFYTGKKGEKVPRFD